MKQKAFFIIFEGLSLKQIKQWGENPTYKFRNIHRKMPVLDSYFNKVAGR